MFGKTYFLLGTVRSVTQIMDDANQIPAGWTGLFNTMADAFGSLIKTGRRERRMMPHHVGISLNDSTKKENLKTAI